MLVEVAVGAPVHGAFTYELEAEALPEPGRRLVVPFGRRRAIGFLLGPTDRAPEGPLRKVEQVLDDGPVFTPDVFELIRFAADYYAYPLGEALRGALPPELARLQDRERKARAPAVEAVELTGAVELALAAVGRSRSQAALLGHLAARGGKATLEELKLAVKGAPALLKKLEEKGLVRLLRGSGRREDATFHLPDAPALTDAQARACQTLAEATGFAPFLLHGVTGSGKTEVYLHAIAEARERGKSALVLVPEIALTPQLAGRFESRFGGEVALLHSGLGDRERSQQHARLLSGEARIALGVRSAVFAPLRDLGIVVVDEEHEPSFKQEEKLRYHARDLAVYRARICGVPCVLGSATPSLETLRNVREGRYGLLELPQRVDERSLPPVHIVDLAAKKSPAPRRAPSEDEPPMLGPELSEALEQTLQAKQQAILFLNRRGNASLVLCADCGESARCDACDVTLTHHLHRDELRCHYCDFRTRKPRQCPHCQGELLVLGVGTERIEKELVTRFPRARVARLDRDAASTSTELTRILTSFARGEADVLVGTQMVAKGHDFPGVTLVGVVLADVGLGLPDFRAAERTFQLLTQVAGRAGRGADAGRVVIQAFNASAEAIVHAAAHDYARFSEGELQRRRELGYPPYSRMLALRLEGENGSAVEQMARRLADGARRMGGGQLRILGPAPAPIPKLRGRMRHQLLLVAQSPGPLQRIARLLQPMVSEAPHGVKVAFDVDPVSML